MGVSRNVLRAGIAAIAVTVVTGCASSIDFDLRNMGSGFNTTGAAQSAVADRPVPDNRGVISYPNYQVAIAQRGDTIGDVATRIGIDAGALARFNGVPEGIVLRSGEVLALPERVAEPSPATGAIGTGPIRAPGEVDVTAIAGAAIDRAGPGAPVSSTDVQTGIEPIRHRVEQGETAFTIARLYGVSVRALAEWNGLSADLDVREGQFLLIPVVLEPVAAADTAPGQGSPTPTPPSATTALPRETTTPVATAAATPPSPDLGSQRTAASDTAKLLLPVSGPIMRGYKKGENDGIDIRADAGAAVRAADGGTVAAITRDTDGIPILVLRHSGNLLTVYAGVDKVAVEKGDTVKRGDRIAEVRAGNPSFVHFEVREGFDSVDPLPFLN